ncbi:S24 family peptidase [Sphingomonas profundi]|uniref:S24 family peptidase n=1 Tax=Alterirhizorhabdus profundi TaxID=2681549 RepID=UPI0012E96FBD|nr:S24 family peptidase [Sphingomonas profundi]
MLATPETPRAALQRLIEERREDYAALSRMLGRNAAYIQQFIKRGTPRRLHEQDRATLARYFGVSETLLGGSDRIAGADLVPVPVLAVHASAGHGANVVGEERLGAVAFDPAWLRRLTKGATDGLSIIRVSGESMAPALADGDEVLVDRRDGAERLRDGIYVLRLDDSLMIKRLARQPQGRRITIGSDNPAFPSWQDVDPARIDILGRVLWYGRTLA